MNGPVPERRRYYKEETRLAPVRDSPSGRRLDARDRVLRLQSLVDERDRHAALADACGHPLYGTRADVARGEDTWNGGLEQERLTFRRPMIRFYHICAGEHESVRIAGDLWRQPCSVGVGADEDEQCRRRSLGRRADTSIDDIDRF